MNVKNRKAQQSQRTRGVLLQAARELFAKKGYAHTAAEEIVQRAGVTRGALYHHFRNKEDLFQAVFETIEQELIRRVLEAADLGPCSPWERLSMGCQAFLDSCLDPSVQRIAFLDAPAVLGWETWRQIDAQYGFRLLREGLQAAMEQGFIEPQPLDSLTHLLLGALIEAAMAIARSKDVKLARAEMGASLTRLLDGLRQRSPTREAKGLGFL